MNYEEKARDIISVTTIIDLTWEDAQRVKAEFVGLIIEALKSERQAALEEAAQIVRDAVETYSVHANPNAILNAFYGGQLDAADEILNRITALKTGVGLHASQQPHAPDAASPRG